MMRSLIAQPTATREQRHRRTVFAAAPTSVPGGSQDSPIDSFRAGATQFYPQEAFDYQERNGFISNEINFVSTKEGPFQWITAIGIPTASSPGATIALRAPTVTMSTAVP